MQNFLPSPTDRLLRLPDVQGLTGLCRSSIYEAIAIDAFPRPVKLGRASAWPQSEVAEWIASRKAARASA